MFGMGGTEILVILIVALLFLGPDKLPDAAKQISKGIRDIKKQSRALQQTIEDDEHIGGAIRDLKSALRGEEMPVRPRTIKPPKQIEASAEPGGAVAAAAAGTLAADSAAAGADPEAGTPEAPGTAQLEAPGSGEPRGEPAPAEPPKLTLPATAGEPDGDAPGAGREDAALSVLVKPAPNTIARGAVPSPAPTPAPSPAPDASSEPKHG